MNIKTKIFIEKTNYPIAEDMIGKDVKFAKAYMLWLEQHLKEFKIIKNIQKDESIEPLTEEFLSFLQRLPKEKYNKYVEEI